MNTKRILELAEGTIPATADAFLCVQDTDSTPVTRRLTFAVLLTLFSTLNKGTWSGVTSYAKGEIVERNGASYQCILASLNNAPPNATYWRLIADKGATGAAGSTWHSGTGAPAAELGSDGDYYFRTSNSDIYKKAAGTWSIIANIEGATGDSVEWIVDAGAPGAGDGEDGDMYLNSSNGDVYGPKASGAWPGAPSANIKGPQGDPGSGDIDGPASAINERIAVFDGITGKLLKDGGKAIAELQPIDATLTALAAITTASDKLIYATGSDTFSTTTLTVAARDLLDDVDSSAMRTTLGLGTMATASAADYLPLAGGTMTGALTLHASSLLKWGDTASYPALKRNGTELQVRLADDSGYASLRAGTLTVDNSLLVPYGEVQFNGASWVFDTSYQMRAAPYARIQWVPAGNWLGAQDTELGRAGVGTVGIWNKDNLGCALKVHGIYTDASNYVRASLAATSTSVTLAAETAGTGADNVDLVIKCAGSGAIMLRDSSSDRGFDLYKHSPTYWNLVASDSGSPYFQFSSNGGISYPGVAVTAETLAFGAFSSTPKFFIAARAAQVAGIFPAAGASSAGQKLEIYGQTDGVPFNTQANYVRASLAATSTSVTLAAETAGTGADDIDLILSPAGTGKVGIGTASPTQLLSVGSVFTVSSAGVVTIKTGGSGLGGNQGLVAADGAGGIALENGTLRIEPMGGASRTTIGNGIIYLGDGAVECLRYDDSTDQFWLSQPLSFAENNAPTGVYDMIRWGDGAGTASQNPTYVSVSALKTAANEYGLTFDVSTAATKSERMRLSPTGFLGIGTTSPTAYLDLPASTTSAASIRIRTGTAPTSPNSGDVWHDSTQKTLSYYAAGVTQTVNGVLFTQTNTVTVANTVTETALTGTGTGTLTLPANFFAAGKTIKIRALGYHSSTASPNITIRVKLGSTTILTTGAISSGNGSDDAWVCDAFFTCRTTGGTGTVIGQGYYEEVHGTGNRGGMVNTATTTIDTTASQAISITVEWGTADAGNTISCTNVLIEVLN